MAARLKGQIAPLPDASEFWYCKRALIVEDDAHIAELRAYISATNPYAVAHAADGSASGRAPASPPHPRSGAERRGYLAKPFSMLELGARVKALLRRIDVLPARPGPGRGAAAH